VSTRSGRGKHTTRNVSLLPISEGGYLADTPGFNQPSLMKVTKQSLSQHFPEVSTFNFVYFALLGSFYAPDTVIIFCCLILSDGHSTCAIIFRFKECSRIGNPQNAHSVIACILANQVAL